MFRGLDVEGFKGLDVQGLRGLDALGFRGLDVFGGLEFRALRTDLRMELSV